MPESMTTAPAGLALLVMILWLAGCDATPEPSPQTGQASASSAVAEQQAKIEAAAALRRREAEELDKLIAAMQPVYDQLDRERKRISKLHERLTRRFARQDLPSEHAPEIVRIMSDVSYLLRNPKQLGAFKSVAGIQVELDSVIAAGRQLDQVNAWVPERR